MKQLLSYFKPYLKESFLAPLFKLLEAVFELLVPMVIAGIVDQSIPQKDQGHLWMQMGFLFVFAVIGVLVALVAQFYSAKAAVGFAKELTNDLYRHILSLPKDSRDRLTTSSFGDAFDFRYLSDSDRDQSIFTPIFKGSYYCFWCHFYGLSSLA